MCELNGKKCDTCSTDLGQSSNGRAVGSSVCYEVQVITDAGMTLEFTYDPREQDNSILKTWFFATDCVEGLLVRGVGNTVWTSITRQEWLDEFNQELWNK